MPDDVKDDQPDEHTIQLGKLMKKALGNKETRKAALQVARSADPTLTIPELEAEAAITAATAPLHEEIKNLKAEQTKKDQLADLAARRKPLVDKGMSADEIKKVEQFMVDKGIADHEIAYRVMTENDRVAAPRSGRFTPPSLPESEDKALYKDPRGHARKVGHQMVDDFARSRRT